MNFELGSYVFVAGHGVGQVLSLDTKTLGSAIKEFLQIKLISSDAKILVPVEASQNIRKIITKDEVIGIYEFLQNRENIKFNKSTWNRRSRDYMEKINTGSLLNIAEVLREILLIQIGKKLSFSEKKVLEMCKDHLVREISISTGHEATQISGQIDSIFSAVE